MFSRVSVHGGFPILLPFLRGKVLNSSTAAEFAALLDTDGASVELEIFGSVGGS